MFICSLLRNFLFYEQSPTINCSCVGELEQKNYHFSSCPKRPYTFELHLNVCSLWVYSMPDTWFNNLHLKRKIYAENPHIWYLLRSLGLGYLSHSLYLMSDLEWKLTYVGSAEDEKYDQLLDIHDYLSFIFKISIEMVEPKYICIIFL